ncbi:MAG: DUF262 domain-containing HNH endonuclease family protein [Lentisphaerota bacterium]
MPELNVTRKNIEKLFSEMQGKIFVVPDYQRPYKWDVEKCETLWNDITTFFSDKKDGDEYFLGTIVTCESDNKNEIDIIDGQQRITSLFLLLRAFYKKLEGMKEDDNIIGLKNQIAPCIWNVNEISGKVTDMSQIHIKSRVATENNNDIFHSILKTGSSIDDNEDVYTKNYSFFFSKCEEYAKDNPTYWQPLCVTILKKCIVLPIECKNIDIALTIFSTLNDRGLPLSDSDIFKAQIYRNQLNPVERQAFATKWKDLTETAEDACISLDDLFRYYTHFIRAKSQDKSKEIGLRKFYSADKWTKLKYSELMSDLPNLADFWFTINSGKTVINDIEKISLESQKYLHCLQCYPNEYWKYIVSVYYYVNSEKTEFIDSFSALLKRLTAYLYSKFIEKPTVNAIKDDIYQGCIDIFNNKLPLSFSLNSEFKSQISATRSFKTAKGMILLHAYQNKNQTTLIPEKFEIEHIFPRNWQNTNYNGWEKTDAQIYLEKFGNKTAIEKKINIQAGNGYFGKKKAKYRDSKISNVLDLSSFSKNDWVKEDIELRDSQFVETIYSFFTENMKE